MSGKHRRRPVVVDVVLHGGRHQPQAEGYNATVKRRESRVSSNFLLSRFDARVSLRGFSSSRRLHYVYLDEKRHATPGGMRSPVPFRIPWDAIRRGTTPEGTIEDLANLFDIDSCGIEAAFPFEYTNKG